MTTRQRKQIDQFEQAVEAVLSPGNFISYAAVSSFVNDVRGVAGDIEKMIKTEPEGVALLLETFIGACHEKDEEIDNSTGDFGMLVEDLFLDCSDN